MHNRAYTDQHLDAHRCVHLLYVYIPPAVHLIVCLLPSTYRRFFQTQKVDVYYNTAERKKKIKSQESFQAVCIYAYHGRLNRHSQICAQETNAKVQLPQICQYRHSFFCSLRRYFLYTHFHQTFSNAHILSPQLRTKCYSCIISLLEETTSPRTFRGRYSNLPRKTLPLSRSAETRVSYREPPVINNPASINSLE